MERTAYAILAVLALVTVAVGIFTTDQPLGVFFVESLRQFLTTTAAMAWITWWTLVVGFAIGDRCHLAVLARKAGTAPRPTTHGYRRSSSTSMHSFAVLFVRRVVTESGLRYSVESLCVESPILLFDPDGQEPLNFAQAKSNRSKFLILVGTV